MSRDSLNQIRHAFARLTIEYGRAKGNVRNGWLADAMAAASDARAAGLCEVDICDFEAWDRKHLFV